MKEGWGVHAGYEGSPRIPRDSGGKLLEMNVVLLLCSCAVKIRNPSVC